MFPQKEIVFVDDTPHVLEEVRQSISDIILLQMTRTRGVKPTACSYTQVRNFGDVTSILRVRTSLPGTLECPASLGAG